MQQDLFNKQKLMKRIVLGFALFVAVFAVSWLATHSYVVVTLKPDNKDKVTIELLDQKSGKTTKKTVEPGTTTKILTSRGGKEVFAKQGERSQLVITSAKGFLTSTAVTIEPLPEKARQFVGNNPLPCSQLSTDTLYSYGCGSSIGQLQIHRPASSSEPTSITDFKGDQPGSIIGSLSEGSSLVAVAQLANEGDGGTYSYVRYVINNQGALISNTVLNTFGNGQYLTVPYKDGLLAYSDNFDGGIALDSTASSQNSVKFDKPKDTKLSPYIISTTGEQITVGYTGEIKDMGSESGSVPKVKTEVVIQGKGKTRHITLKEQYGFVKVCGENALCVIGDRRLKVLDISKDKPKLLYELTGVKDVIDTANSLLITRNNELLSVNIAKRTAVAEYIYGDYRPCGVNRDGNGYEVCVINAANDKLALYIDPTKPNTDSIDKKIQKLHDPTVVKSVSINGRFIYISPELGERTYQQSIGGFGYDPTKRTSAAAKILQLVRSAGIDPTIYTIINTRP